MLPPPPPPPPLGFDFDTIVDGHRLIEAEIGSQFSFKQLFYEICEAG